MSNENINMQNGEEHREEITNITSKAEHDTESAPVLTKEQKIQKYRDMSVDDLQHLWSSLNIELGKTSSIARVHELSEELRLLDSVRQEKLKDTPQPVLSAPQPTVVVPSGGNGAPSHSHNSSMTEQDIQRNLKMSKYDFMSTEQLQERYDQVKAKIDEEKDEQVVQKLRTKLDMLQQHIQPEAIQSQP
eukprot:GILJ01008312.1.p1 GENE.GILJ01008312.1~~GILJ01008312.1.p1  ORF type:complete len:189 (+),score=35.58 GILJ01008312.1:157-723(+)